MQISIPLSHTELNPEQKKVFLDLLEWKKKHIDFKVSLDKESDLYKDLVRVFALVGSRICLIHPLSWAWADTRECPTPDLLVETWILIELPQAEDQLSL